MKEDIEREWTKALGTPAVLEMSTSPKPEEDCPAKLLFRLPELEGWVIGCRDSSNCFCLLVVDLAHENTLWEEPNIEIPLKDQTTVLSAVLFRRSGQLVAYLRQFAVTLQEDHSDTKMYRKIIRRYE